MSGTGSPTAWHKNVTFSSWSLISSSIKFSILGMTATQWCTLKMANYK